MKGLRVALGFLTAIPVKVSPPDSDDIGRSAAWFPLIGVGLGAVLTVLQASLSRLFPPTIVGALTVSAWVALTGGLHLEGLGDCGDGLFAVAPRERRLEIMRDPRLGAFGTIALALCVILKVHAVASLPKAVNAEAGSWLGLFLPVAPLVLSTVLARWVILLVALQPTARPDGLGARFARSLEPRLLIVAALMPLVLTLLGGWRSLVAAVLAHAVALSIVVFARARLGGVTGDVFGLTVEVVELSVILAFTSRFEGA